jgi:TolB protein
MMPDFRRKTIFALATTLLTMMPAAAVAQDVLPVIAIPPVPTPRNVTTDAGQTGVIGIQIADQIASDLRSSGDFMVIPRDTLKQYSPTEAGAPLYQNWTGTGASNLVTGYVQSREDGRLTVACYLYDLKQRREISRKGYVVDAKEWRRAAHRCADAFYERISGSAGYFDSTVAYVAETGTRTSPVKRLAIMNWDATDHRYLTQGESTVLGPRLSPDGERIAYVSFSGGAPHVRIRDVDGNEDRALLPQGTISFAPRCSPDGRRLLLSMAVDGNTDIYLVGVDGNYPQRLTSTPGVDTAASFSPDGSRIVFESDRSGRQQVYVMNSNGSGQQRISFGAAGYASPVWSPSGDRIAFTRATPGKLQIGVMRSDGGEEKMLTDGWQDEAPVWAGGRTVLFQRTDPQSTHAAIYSVPITGGQPKRLTTPQPGSDPDWSGGS